MNNEETFSKEKMEKLYGTFTELANRFNLHAELKTDDGWEDLPGGMLIVENGTMCAWYDNGKYCADYGRDTSDPSVGIFEAWEPRTFGTKDKPPLVVSACLYADLKVVNFLIVESIKILVDAELADIYYDRIMRKAEMKKKISNLEINLLENRIKKDLTP